jgi:enoyl-CoA hydratase/carnithine racemase
MLESIKSRDELYKMSRNGQEIIDQFEQSSKLIVAAIAGTCLGGGFEVSFFFSRSFLLLVFFLSGCFGMSLSYCTE